MVVKFQVPEIQSKTIADSTKKLYITQLNKLAKQEWNTPEKLLENQAEIVKFIEELHPGKDSDELRQKKRVMMSAVFYVLADTDHKHKDTFYQYFQTISPLASDTWTPRADYLKLVGATK